MGGRGECPWGVCAFERQCRAPVQGIATLTAAPRQRGAFFFGREGERVDWASEMHHVRLSDAKGRKVGERPLRMAGREARNPFSAAC